MCWHYSPVRIHMSAAHGMQVTRSRHPPGIISAFIDLLKKLSFDFENGNTASSTIYDNLPDAYKLKLVKAIVAFELEVTELENVHKLSQNRDEKSYDNIVQQLKNQDGDAKVIGEMMEERKGKVFDH